MRTTKAISISLLPSEIRQARLLAKQTNRSLSGLFREGLKLLREDRPATDEYTPAQRRFIDARIAAGLEDFRKGRFHGPFDTAEEAIASMKTNLKRRAVAKKAKA
jgi:predicted transcriptional regulator